MKILFAFAVNKSRHFEKKHFGEASMFLIYEYSENKCNKKEEIPNKFSEPESSNRHGSPEEAEAILSLMQSRDVKVLVSRQFGRNLSLVNRSFIPVIIDEEEPEKVTNILCEKINWIKDELKNRQKGYMLFRIKNGVLKTDVRMEKF